MTENKLSRLTFLTWQLIINQRLADFSLIKNDRQSCDGVVAILYEESLNPCWLLDTNKLLTPVRNTEFMKTYESLQFSNTKSADIISDVNARMLLRLGV